MKFDNVNVFVSKGEVTGLLLGDKCDIRGCLHCGELVYIPKGFVNKYIQCPKCGKLSGRNDKFQFKGRVQESGTYRKRWNFLGLFNFYKTLPMYTIKPIMTLKLKNFYAIDR